MFERLIGEVVEKQPARAVVRVGGILSGAPVRIWIPTSCWQRWRAVVRPWCRSSSTRPASPRSCSPHGKFGPASGREGDPRSSRLALILSADRQDVRRKASSERDSRGTGLALGSKRIADTAHGHLLHPRLATLSPHSPPVARSWEKILTSSIHSKGALRDPWADPLLVDARRQSKPSGPWRRQRSDACPLGGSSSSRTIPRFGDATACTSPCSPPEALPRR